MQICWKNLFGLQSQINPLVIYAKCNNEVMQNAGFKSLCVYTTWPFNSQEWFILT